MDTNTALGGISAPGRARLARLLREAHGPLTVQAAGAILGLDHVRASKILADFAARGWLTRVRRDLYTAVPIEAAHPAAWREDPWVVAAATFAPCYIGGWSAAAHWGLTDQLFRDVIVVSAHPVRDRRPVIQDTAFRVKTIPTDKLFGTRTIWRGQTPVPVSDPARTLVDLLDDPGLGGGMRHVAEIVTEYFAGEWRDDPLLLAYIERFGNRAVYKRLGYLVETLGIAAPDLLATCLARQSAGFSLLQPGLAASGPFLRRWRLRLNTRVT